MCRDMGDWAWIIPLLSALLGAGVAGGIAHMNARDFAKRQEHREIEREAQRQGERRLALAHAVVFKVQRATDLITKVTRHVIDARVMAAQRGWPLWQANAALPELHRGARLSVVAHGGRRQTGGRRQDKASDSF